MLREPEPSYMNSPASQLIRFWAYLLVAPLFLMGTLASSDSYNSPETIAGSYKIDAEGLIELVNENEKQIIIDARIQSDRKQGYIPGSISLPDTETRCDTLARLIPEKSDAVIFYCNGPKCRRSDHAVAIAVTCGYTNIYWFRGGIEAWKADSYPISK